MRFKERRKFLFAAMPKFPRGVLDTQAVVMQM